ncbi:hypothetical protein V6N13_013987 [Hibiscus sabdariffa]
MVDPIKDLGVEANMNHLLDEVKSMSNRMKGMSLEKKNLEAERDAALSREKSAEKRVAESHSIGCFFGEQTVSAEPYLENPSKNHNAFDVVCGKHTKCNAFERHGNVLDAFIARRLSRRGRKFGFVRFGDSTDALRALERLNGFIMYGFKLTVALATPKRKGKVWDKGIMGRNSLSAENGDSSKGGSFSGQTQRGLNQRIRVIDNLQEAGRAVGVVSNQGGKEKRRMVGHVEEDDLWKMKRCLVGEMATVCSVRNISLRLQEWG